MAYIEFNNNPAGRRVGDCAVRAISKALNMGWEGAYIALTIAGIQMGDMPNSDSVSGALLRQHGFERRAIPNTCPDCYTIKDFCEEHPHGIFVLYTGGHVCCVESGNLYDSWNSEMEIPQYVWFKPERSEE